MEVHHINGTRADIDPTAPKVDIEPTSTQRLQAGVLSLAFLLGDIVARLEANYQIAPSWAGEAKETIGQIIALVSPSDPT